MTEPLFDATPYEVTRPDPLPADLSADQRRTLRQRRDIEQGRHPLAGAPLHEQAPTDVAPGDRGRPFTCGTCSHRSSGSRYRWPKCDIGPQSRGAATDVRAWWPACIHYDDTPKGTP